MKIYDTKQKQKVDFVPIIEGQVRIYVCGPTVYDDAHLGHARSAIAFDLLSRVLRANGYQVTLAKNFTDIDDKIIAKALREKISVEDLSLRYIKAYLRDMDALLVQRADLEPKASQNLKPIALMIEKLLDNNIAYKSPNGDIYLDVSKDLLYGNVSNRGGLDDENLSRVRENESKIHEKDFALWKAYKGEGDVGYEGIELARLGKGRPGWHIECSAMIEAVIAYKEMPYQIDIHGGGMDLAFPHHENEASQTRCAMGVEISKYWMHNGFVNINGEKMSKSLENSFFIKDALKVYDGEILRNYLLGTHYRAVLNFNEEDLLASKKRLDKLYRLKKRVIGEIGIADGHFKGLVLEAMNDDLNISRAISVLEEMMNEANERLDKNSKDKPFKSCVLANIKWIYQLLGIGDKDANKYFQLGISEEQKVIIEDKLVQRDLAKKEKDFVLADKIRDELVAMNIAVLDTPSGSVWEKIV